MLQKLSVLQTKVEWRAQAYKKTSGWNDQPSHMDPAPPHSPQSYQGCHILIFLPPDCIKLRTSCKQGCQRGVKLIILDKLGEENFTCLIPRKNKNLDLGSIAHLWFQHSGQWGRRIWVPGQWTTTVRKKTFFPSTWNIFCYWPCMIT